MSAFIPGNRARWCIDCNAATDAETCPGCGNRHTWPLLAWLDRPQGKLMVEHEGTKTRIWREENAT